MSRQEKIREGMAEHLRNETYPNCNFPKRRCDKYIDCCACEVDSLLEYLDSQGCKLTVEGELAKIPRIKEMKRRSI